MLCITCHGAVDEIGGNKILLEDGGSALMLDFGKSFSAMGAYFDEFLQPRTNSSLRDLLALGVVPAMPGIYRRDLLTHGGAWEEVRDAFGISAEARGLFECELESCEDYTEMYGKPRLDGILLSHGHTDHCQHLCFVHPNIPVFCSSVTAAIIRATEDTGRGGLESDIRSRNCRSVGLCGRTSTFPDAIKIGTSEAAEPRPIHAVEPFSPFQVGAFVVEAVPVDHSVPGACAFIVTSPSGTTVFYTGDLRFHGRFSLGPGSITDTMRRRVTGLKPDVMITEGTRISDDNGNVTSAGDDEQDVEDRIKQVVAGCSGLAIVDFSWKDITRFQTILNVAKATGRVIAVSPKLAYLWELLRAQAPSAYPDLTQEESVRVYLKRTESMLYSLADYSSSKHLVGVCVDWGEKSREMKDRYAQGDTAYLEPRLRHYNHGIRAYDIAADPSRYILQAGYYDMNELFDVSPPDGSVYISAITEPFSDEMTCGEKRLENWLRRFHLIDSASKVSHYHVSGHANGADLLSFIGSVDPKTVVPIHTQHPEVFEREIGSERDVVRPTLGEPINL